MADLRTDYAVSAEAPNTPEQHVADHLQLALRANQVVGPFPLNHDTVGIDSGVSLFTPNLGDRIIGVYLEFHEAFSATDEKIGLGVAGTTDGDLQFLVDAPVLTLPTPPATFPAQYGVGLAVYSTVLTITAPGVPLIARTLVGGNSTGRSDLYVVRYAV